MRLIRANSGIIFILIYLVVNTMATAITLSIWQPISGFSESCCAAYNTPLTQCAQSDFENGRSCSMSCVAMLEEVSALLQKACRGTRSDPDTLIEMFLSGGGVQALCPNVQESGGSTGNTGGNTGGNSGGNPGGDTGENNGGAQNSQTGAASSTPQIQPRPSPSTTQTTVSITQQTTQTTQSIQSQPSAASTETSLLKSTVSTTIPAIQPTINSAATLTQSDLTGLKSGAASDTSSSSTSSTARASATAQKDRNSNGNSGGSGGTPFDISASAPEMAATSTLLASALGLIVLIWIV